MKKIVRVMCMVHQDSITPKNIKKLQVMMRDRYQEHFGNGSRLIFVWLTLPEGQAYIAGELSTASTVQMPVEDHLIDERRHRFMGEVCSRWQSITDCNKNEIILTCPDSTDAKSHFTAVTQRINSSKRGITQLKVLMKMLLNYFKKGYLNTSINF